MAQVHYDVPFVGNPDRRCVVASVGMVLAYFMPMRKFTMPELEQICDYVEGEGAWEFAHMLYLDDLGLELRYISDFDIKAFVEDPKAYLTKIIKDPAVLQSQLESIGEVHEQAARAREYLNRGLHYEHRPGTEDDIRRLLDDGWLVRLEVDASTLAGKTGYDPHSVLVIGYDEGGVFMHNPDGANGNKPNQHVSWKDLAHARQAYGDSSALYAFRGKKEL